MQLDGSTPRMTGVVAEEIKHEPNLLFLLGQRFLEQINRDSIFMILGRNFEKLCILECSRRFHIVYEWVD